MTEQQATRRRYLGVLGAVGTAWLAGCSDAFGAGSGIDEETSEQYIGVATRIATELQEWHRARSETTRRLAGTDVIQNGQPDEQQQWLEAEIEGLPEEVYRVHLVDPSDWHIVASTTPAKRGEPLTSGEAPWQGEPIDYDGVFVARAQEAFARSMVSFVTRLDGDRQRLLVVQTNMDILASTFQQPSEGVYTQIIDADGRIVASTRRADLLERNDGSLSAYPGGGDARAVQLALAGESGFLAEPAINDSDQGGGDADSYVVAYASVEDRDWAVLTHEPV